MGRGAIKSNGASLQEDGMGDTSKRLVPDGCSGTTLVRVKYSVSDLIHLRVPL